MKRSVRLHLTGSIQSLFFRQWIKDHADKNDVRGYLRNLEDGRVEIFLEGNIPNVNTVLEICKKGPNYTKIRQVDIKEEKFQDFKDFKVLKF